MFKILLFTIEKYHKNSLCGNVCVWKSEKSCSKTSRSQNSLYNNRSVNFINTSIKNSTLNDRHKPHNLIKRLPFGYLIVTFFRGDVL